MSNSVFVMQLMDRGKGPLFYVDVRPTNENIPHNLNLFTNFINTAQLFYDIDKANRHARWTKIQRVAEDIVYIDNFKYLTFEEIIAHSTINTQVTH